MSKGDCQPKPRVLIVRAGEAWLADDPGKRAVGELGALDDLDGSAVLEWLRKWGQKELGVEVRDV